MLTALAVDQASARRDLLPPGLQDPRRRGLGLLVLSFLFWLAVFLPLLTPELTAPPDPAALDFWDLFLLQGFFLACLALWLCLGLCGVSGLPWEQVAPAARRHCSLTADPARTPTRELAVGLLAGFAIWVVVLLSSALFEGVLRQVGGGDLVTLQEPSPLIVWLAGLPVVNRLLISCTAGVVEEVFFRGFLQPRVGITLSTALFVCGHLGYGQPFMLFGVTLLSLLYALLVRWRGSVWAAIAAHAFFDAVQLLVVIPAILGQPV